MKRFGIILLTIWTALFLTFSTSCSEDTRTDNTSTGTAVSLKILQKRLAGHHAEKTYPEELIQLGSITHVVGYVIDETNHDVILIGKVGTPSVHLEDFVVALRNAWLKYAKVEGNTYHYSDPGCSIDPDSQVLQQLQDISQHFLNNSSPESAKKYIHNWDSICQLPQKVRVMGIPFHCRSAWVMVKADYDMKKLVDGSDSLSIPGFISLSDMLLEKAKTDITQGKPLSIPVSLMNRFWFYPGENKYIEDAGIVIIKQCPVILLTEEEYLGRGGGAVGKGHPNLFAQEFTESFSALYPEIANQRPIYSELENLFRFVALAKIIKFKSPHKDAGLDLKCLLSHYRIREITIKHELPGRSNVKEFKHRRDFEGGYQTAHFYLPTCGGVEISMAVNQENFEKDTTGMLSKLRVMVLNARPSPKDLSWSFPTIDIVRFDDEEHISPDRFVFAW